MDDATAETALPGFFLDNLPHGFIYTGSAVEERLLREYGAVFVASGGVVPPRRVVFESEEQVSAFQNSVKKKARRIGEFEMILQWEAMDTLLSAVGAAMASDLSITPRGPDSAARTYAQTVLLWASRVEPALDHWTSLGRLSLEKATHIRNLSPFEQVPEIFELEEQGIWFAKDLSKSIIYSVAPPGTSQHLSLLAFDVTEFSDPRVREILNYHGWYQTVASDLPHFTFLGIAEIDLPNYGLRKVANGEFSFWIPAL